MKVETIDELINIVGVNAYIEFLTLNYKNLCFDGYQIDEHQNGCFAFHYQNEKMEVVVDFVEKRMEGSCTCSKKQKNNCGHITLGIKYLLEGNLLKTVEAESHQAYSQSFNKWLIELLNQEKENTIFVGLEVTLKELNRTCYELELKIGECKKYVMRRFLKDFLTFYNNGQGEFRFGKEFTYQAHIHAFCPIDKQIIQFVEKLYYKQLTDYGYSYYHTIDLILEHETLSQFLSLLKNRSFFIESAGERQLYHGIEQKELTFAFQQQGEDVEMQIEMDFVPITPDFCYVKENNHIYSIDSKQAHILRAFQQNHRTSAIFKKEELSTLAFKVLAPLQSLSNQVVMRGNLQEHFSLLTLPLRLYLEAKKDQIVAIVKFEYQQKEYNIFTEVTSSENYLIRDKKEEEKLLMDLSRSGFTKQQDRFILNEEEKIVSFLENGLADFYEKYDVYVSKSLKNMKVITTSHIQSDFSLGSGNILNYHFQIEGIALNEMKHVLDALQERKKYYRLKNGDFVNLSDPLLEKFGQITSDLELTNQELENGNASFPAYKSLYLDHLDQDFVQIGKDVEIVIKKVKQFQKQQIDFTEVDLQLLRDYQELGVKWFYTLAQCGFGGILADEMGLGKSLQFIKYMKLRLQEDSSRKFLIIAPTSLLYNWEHEIQKFEPDISYVIVNGVRKRREELLNQTDSYSLLITSYGLARQDLKWYQKYTFDTCMIDEAQAIKNVHADTTMAVKQINASVHFALTGTPLENSILELWSIFDFIMPRYLPSFSRFKREYASPITSQDIEKIESLNQMIRPFILRRKKVDVLKELPPKMENNVLVELDLEQKKIYMAQLDKTKQQIEDTIKKEGFAKSQIYILSLLTKLRQICIDPRLLFENYQGPASKMENLVNILAESVQNGHKILVFSQFTSALQLVMNHLKQAHFTYYYLAGSTSSKERMRLVDQFNQDDTNVFLISLHAGGTGLNLTSADIVIHLDPWWNPQVENQATDRSHRIGQKNVVQVIKLIAQGTIEEKIIELQKQKQELSNQIIDGKERDQLVLTKLTEQELRSLLS